MSSIVIAGDTSGSVTLQAPATAGTTILTLPATSGTVITSASGTAATATNLAGGSNGTIPYQSASGTTQMLAVGTAGQLLQTNGAGAPTWATVSAGVGDHEIVVTSGNGHGSTNTKIRRYTTTQSSVGSAITYADSASNGASFTINSAGIYAITTRDASSTSAPQYGISLNSTQLTTNIQNITAANRLCFYIPYSTNCPADITVVVSLAVNDVIRPHNDGSADNTTAAYVGLRIRKIGNI